MAALVARFVNKFTSHSLAQTLSVDCCQIRRRRLPFTDYRLPKTKTAIRMGLLSVVRWLLSNKTKTFTDYRLPFTEDENCHSDGDRCLLTTLLLSFGCARCAICKQVYIVLAGTNLVCCLLSNKTKTKTKTVMCVIPSEERDLALGLYVAFSSAALAGKL